MPQTKRIEISVIIPNFNGEALLKKNLPSVMAAYKNPRNNIKEIIVVDDASTDESVSLIKRDFKNIRMIKLTQNRGFSVAVNTGVRSSKGQLLALINSDVSVEENFLEHLGTNFEDDAVFAVSMHEQGNGWAIGKFENGFIDIKPGKEDSVVHKSFFASGGSGVFNKKIWTELGGLDDKLLSPFYWEDLDICYRALKRGYKVLWDHTSRVLHNHESTIGKLNKKQVSRIKERNQLLVIWKNITSTVLIRKHVLFLFKRMLRHPGYVKVFFMALSKIRVVILKRRKEIRESRLSDEAVFSKF